MRSYGWGFRLLTAFAAEWWGPPEETGGDGRRREASPQSHPRFAAAHTPVYAGACTIPQNARAFCGTPIPPVSVPLLASVARNPLMCGGCRHLTAPHCGFALCGVTGILSLRDCLRKISSLAHRKSHLAPRTSHLAPRTSHIAHRTSQIVHRKSHIAHRTSHIARLSKFYLSLPPENAKYNKL